MNLGDRFETPEGLKLKTAVKLYEEGLPLIITDGKYYQFELISSLDIDGNEIYDINTGKSIGDIDIAEESQFQELVEGGNYVSIKKES